jgi:hypothetical protein
MRLTIHRGDPLELFIESPLVLFRLPIHISSNVTASLPATPAARSRIALMGFLVTQANGAVFSHS